MDNRLLTFVGPASSELGAQVCATLRHPPGKYACHRFPDGEVQIEIQESVRGADVFLLQATSPPVEGRLMELLLLADACRRAGAGRLTAVIPYFGYARQDRRTERRSLGGRVAADVIAAARFDRVMLIDAHTPAIEGFFEAPIDHLTAVPLLARAVSVSIPADVVVVAPDLGAVKRAREFARRLRAPLAFVHKTRLDGEAVEAHEVIGNVRDRVPIIVDDMISTGGTIEAAVRALQEAGGSTPMIVAVTHALLVGRAREVLGTLPIARLVAGDTVAIQQPAEKIEIVSVAPLIASAIWRNHRDQSLADLRASE
jgi:ribose-phosphate pyrophosphokinase